jgi:hypothetical protein
MGLINLSGNDQLLHLAGPLIDAEGTNIAIKLLNRDPTDDSASAEKLQGLIDDPLGRLGCI